MFIIIGAVFGAVLGGLRAKRRKGRTADILQYATVHAIIFALVGLFLTIIITRMVN